MTCGAITAACGTSGGSSNVPVATTVGSDRPGATPASRRPRPDTGTRTFNEEDSPQGPNGGLQSGKRFLGELSRPLDDYRSNPQAFYAQVKNQGWLGWRASRKCKGDNACQGGAAIGETVVQGINDAHRVPRVLPAAIPGVVIGRVYNTGWYDDATLDLPGGTPTNPDHYYLVLEPAAATDPNLRIAHVRFKENGQALSLEVLPRKLMYKSCGHEPSARERGYGAFSNCTDDPPRAPTAARQAPRRMMAGPADFTTAGIWISCPDGCCSVDGPIHFRDTEPDTLRPRDPRGGRPPTGGRPPARGI
jgi:hypothetical protein